MIDIQLYEKRKRVLKNAKEKKFEQIDYQYMMEESMSEGDDDVVRTQTSDSKIYLADYL